MQIFIIEDNKVIPSPQILLVEPFKTIWDNDKSSGKEEALKYFTYIELFCCRRKTNPYYEYPEGEREILVKDEVFGDKMIELPDIINQAIKRYVHFCYEISPAIKLYEAGLVALENTRIFLNSFEPNERTNAGGLILKPADILSAISKINDSTKGLKSLRNEIEQDFIENDLNKTKKEIGRYEE